MGNLELSPTPVVVIPALRPGEALVKLIRALRAASNARIVVVDDGSGAEYAAVFHACSALPNVVVLGHAANLGKGAALKTGINHALCAHPECTGVLSADADGQHEPEDILRVAAMHAERPGALVLGSREFGPHVPWRSRLGNRLTRALVRLLIGQNLSDTQTGLRAIPRTLLPRLLEISSSGYEFELDMLIAAKHLGCPVIQVPIRTLYEPGNASSHFSPVFDSMRIYFVLLRFTALSLVTAGVDNLVFFAVFTATGGVGQSQIAGRAAAVLFNYAAARRAVFLTRERHRIVLPKYLLLVLASGFVSYALIGWLRAVPGLPVIAAKLAAETALFIANFAIQRDFVFRRRENAGATDWDRYYTRTPSTARLTRRYTAAALLRALRRFADEPGATIVEIGGGNSCFVDDIARHLRPAAYHVIDTNEFGLELLNRRLSPGSPVRSHRRSVMEPDPPVEADVVFSVGLIEHFDRDGTRAAIDGHFRLLKPGGLAILSFPTPTWLYRAARFLCEAVGVWQFPDERPLEAEEVRTAASVHGEVVFEKTLWPLVFTQRFMVVRKAS